MASIACDPKVWNAVLQNEALVVFLSQKSSKHTSWLCSLVLLGFCYRYFIIVYRFATGLDMDSSSDKSAGHGELDCCNTEDRNVIEDIVLNMKVTVVEMMNTLSDYFQNLFGGTGAPDGSFTNSIDKDKAMSASFMGLAVMVMMVVVLDRQ